MSVPVLNTRAVIEDYAKGKIGEIIFDSYGENKDYIILCPEKLAYIIAKIAIKNTVTTRVSASTNPEELIFFIFNFPFLDILLKLLYNII